MSSDTPTKPLCPKRVMPINERRARECGRPATTEVDGKLYCAFHAGVQRRLKKQREQAYRE